MQNPMVAPGGSKFAPFGNKGPKPKIRMTSEVIDYILEKHPITGTELINFRIVFNDDGSYKIEECHAAVPQFIIQLNHLTDSRLDLIVDCENIRGGYDVILDDSLKNSGCRVYVDGHTTTNYQTVIYGSYIHDVGYEDGEVTFIADRIGTLNIYYQRPASTIRSIICPSIERMTPDDPNIKHEIEEQGRHYQRETKAIMVISALFLNHKRRSELRS